MLRPFYSHGYARVNIRDADGRNYKPVVHRLVALVFLGPPPSPSHEVAHIDGDRLNCCQDNLRWTTHAENCRHKDGHGTLYRGEDIASSKLTEDQVVEIRAILRSDDRPSFRKIGEQFAVDEKTIRNIDAGRTWRHLDGADFDDPFLTHICVPEEAHEEVPF